MSLFQRTLNHIRTKLPFWIHPTNPKEVSPIRHPSRLEASKTRCLVLGIESSCDDTGVAIVDNNGLIISEELATQSEIHSRWGGVVPRLAQEAHQDVIDDLVSTVLESIDLMTLSAVAVTIGPGLSLCLRVGVEKAMALSSSLSIPLIPVHHMEAHALVGRMGRHVQFPFLCLLISGGHNLLLVVHGIGVYTQIGTTLDDSLGEAYDKVARMLEIVPAGGAALEKCAMNGDPMRYNFKLPMQKYSNCDFSYSGLKTSVRITIEQLRKDTAISEQAQADLSASFQKVAVDHLCDKVSRGIQWAKENVEDLSTDFILSGGVAANTYVRDRLRTTTTSSNLDLICPAPRLCTDNGVMVAWTGMERLNQELFDPTPVAENREGQWLDLRARWPLTDRRAFPPATARVPKRKRLHPSLTSMTEGQSAQLTTLLTQKPEFYTEQKLNALHKQQLIGANSKEMRMVDARQTAGYKSERRVNGEETEEVSRLGTRLKNRLTMCFTSPPPSFPQRKTKGRSRTPMRELEDSVSTTRPREGRLNLEALECNPSNFNAVLRECHQLRRRQEILTKELKSMERKATEMTTACCTVINENNKELRKTLQSSVTSDRVILDLKKQVAKRDALIRELQESSLPSVSSQTQSSAASSQSVY